MPRTTGTAGSPPRGSRVTDAGSRLQAWTCPAPLAGYDRIVMGHGGGGRLSADLIEHLFLPAFGNGTLAALADAAVVAVPGGRLAFSTDGYVVHPLVFPGGTIGDLAVNGTVNDIAMSGARPAFLSAGFVIEEGLPLETLGLVAEAMAAAARAAGVEIVAGDTKVVDQGKGDGLFVTTSGFGVVPEGVHVAPNLARPGDVVLLSGPVGLHGLAVLSVREGLEFGSLIESDTAPLHGLVAAMLDASLDVHTLRDPTRGGLATSLVEIAAAAEVGIELVEGDVPVPDAVAAGCAFLGLDPLYVANEGRLVAAVAPAAADAVLAAMRAHPLGREACVIGAVVDDHPGIVTARTGIGGTRILDLQIGEQLPRIC